MSAARSSTSLQGRIELLERLLTAFATKGQETASLVYTVSQVAYSSTPIDSCDSLRSLVSKLGFYSSLTVPACAAAGLVQLQQQSLWYLQGHLELLGLAHSLPSSSSPLPQ